MPNPMGAGFFGKLPGTGDFVQRRLPASFVDAWDRHFEQAVSAARARLGEGWAQAWRDGPAWRFVLGAGVGDAGAWAGVMGPATDRVGRCFPMLIAAPLAAAAMAEALANDAWFAAAERVHREAQAAALGVEAFDARVAALPDPLDSPTALSACAPQADWHRAGHWRLPLPVAGPDTGFLQALWRQQAAAGQAMWWTTGAPRVPPSVLLTTGLPAAEAYAGMLDAHCAGAPWQALGEFAAAAGAPAATPPAPRRPDDVAGPLVDPPGMAETPRRVPVAGHASVLQRHDCALTVVVADEGAADPRRQAAEAVGELIGRFVPSDFVAGMQALRTRLLVLHNRLQQLAADHAEPVHEDGALIAVHVTGRWADLLRIGSASAWHWRAGQLRALFAAGQGAAAGEGAGLGGELDDLLFSRTSPVAPGLGAAGQPGCDEIVCEIEAGDRLLLLATRRLAELSPALLAAALAQATPDATGAHIARAVGLGPDAAAWPLAVIEVQP